MSDRWSEKLSDYLDGELESPVRAELERHLEGCGECRATLAELRRVVENAAQLEDRPPTTDLWAGIAERIGLSGGDRDELAARRRRGRGLRERRFSFSLPQLAAAAIALMILSGGAAWLLLRTESPTRPTVASAPTRPGELVSAPPVAGFADSNYDAAVAELERVIAEKREDLDPQTIRVIEENLLLIDRAISQSERALAQDPASAYLTEHLAATMRLKLEFLRQAAQMAGAVS